LELWNNATEELSGPFGFVHQFVDMENVVVSAEFSGTGSEETTCTGALGNDA